MSEHIGMFANSAQSKGPVPSGFMYEGLAHIAGTVDSVGRIPHAWDFNNSHSVEVIARYGKEGYKEYITDTLHEGINQFDIDVLLVSAYSSGLVDNTEVIEELYRRNPGLKIVIGGPAANWNPEVTLKYSGVDAVIYGDCDFNMKSLLDALEGKGSISDVPGAVYWSGGVRGGDIIRNKRSHGNIDTLPFPLYDPEVYFQVDKKIPVSTLRTSVGCRWARCDFCPQPRIHGPYRERSIEDSLAEVEHLKSRYGIKNFRLSDPNPRPEHMHDLLVGLPDDVKVSSFAYSDHEYAFRDASDKLIALFLGIERTGHSDLKALGKTKNPTDYLSSARLLIRDAQAAGVATIMANIVPIVGDSVDAIESHFQNVVDINPDFITATPLGPLPGTKLYRRVLKEGTSSGFCLADNFLERMITWDIDLLAPMDKWNPTPWLIDFEGEFQNPLAITGNHLVKKLAAQGIFPVSDEIVLMAHMLYGGLPADQAGRRKKVMEFQNGMRDAMVAGDYESIDEMVSIMNAVDKAA